MRKSKGIYWLASYPKSGNTWFRIFLANLLNQSDETVDLNAINIGTIASAREWIEYALGFESAHLSHNELDALRPLIYEWYGDTEKVSYHKIHDAYTYLENQQPIIPAANCLGVIYFIRNPLDVAISFANHLSCSIDIAIDQMGNENYAFCSGRFRQFNQLQQKLLSWSGHVNSWMKANEINILVLRYEDMKLNSKETFTRAVQFLQLTATADEIERALSHSHIEKLQQFEKQAYFSEKPLKTQYFFRKGVVGDWRETLTQIQIKRIIHDHGETMRNFGYLDQNGDPILEQGYYFSSS
ncbi:MAG: hypothetical protein A3F11_11720 [Gammaproteobacteria bacterium RIFCSPHIGHO2_12_FULL_37_14]|nr:MAG: hypothetical protein A3F11_11720 [Gammaproteobacteria bacterium RIFCSPHIGHO2_12_FULL_37_14]